MKEYTSEEIDSIFAWADTKAYRVLIEPLEKLSRDPIQVHKLIQLVSGVSIMDIDKMVASEVDVIKLQRGNPTFKSCIIRLYRLKDLVEEKESHTSVAGA